VNYLEGSKMTNTLINDLRQLEHKHVSGRKYQTMRDYVFNLFDGSSVRVPQGFIYDKGSVPRVFWNLLPPDGDDTAAFLLHDWCYVQRGSIYDTTGTKRTISRKKSDFLMFTYQYLLLDINTTKFLDKKILKQLRIIAMHIRIVAMYIGVRAFGWYYWSDTTTEKLLQKIFKK